MQSLLKFKSEEAARAVVEQLTSGSAELKAKLPGILLGMSPDQISHNLAV